MFYPISRPLPNGCLQTQAIPQGHMEGVGTFLRLFTCPRTLEQTLGLPGETRKLLEKFGLSERVATHVSWAMETVTDGLTREGLDLNASLAQMEDTGPTLNY